MDKALNMWISSLIGLVLAGVIFFAGQVAFGQEIQTTVHSDTIQDTYPVQHDRVSDQSDYTLQPTKLVQN